MTQLAEQFCLWQSLFPRVGKDWEEEMVAFWLLEEVWSETNWKHDSLVDFLVFRDEKRNEYFDEAGSHILSHQKQVKFDGITYLLSHFRKYNDILLTTSEACPFMPFHFLWYAVSAMITKSPVTNHLDDFSLLCEIENLIVIFSPNATY